MKGGTSPMFLKKIAVALLVAVMTASMSMTAFASAYSRQRHSSGGSGGGGGGGSTTGMRGASSTAGPGAAAVAGMTKVQEEPNVGAWYVDANGNWKYLFADGNIAKGWQLLKWTWNGQTETKWYFFNMENNYMQTGLTDVSGKQYYLNPISNGFKGMMETGTIDVNGQNMNFAVDTGELLN